ncbi:MAG: cytochrome c biogenesis protein CcsA [Alphaproteobacteria bacterium]|nr:cytochrome c biogenesis protein CcsA [Alphaproteobacteria bacterium]
MIVVLGIGLASLVALFPAAVYVAGGKARRDDGLYLLLLAVAVIGPVGWAYMLFRDGWHSGIAAALWITVAATIVLFAVLVVTTRMAWRLTPLLLPYLAVVGVMALVLQMALGRPLVSSISGTWLIAHIGISVAAYGLLTVAAVAGLSVILQERALKRKRPNALTHVLPSVADGEALQVGLLIGCEVILFLGILSGIAAEYQGSGGLLAFDHKTLLSLLAFFVVGLLLAMHYRAGIHGRGAARWALMAYLLLSLAYPGVKFVTDVLLV